jgi:hypothetical protein
MLHISKAEVADIKEIYKIHTDCIESLKKSLNVGSETYLDYRTKEEVTRIISEGESIIVRLNNIPVAYFLYVKTGRKTITSKGIVVTEEGKGLGLQRLVHNLKSKKYKCSYVVSKYNDVSLKNVLSLGLKVQYSINEIDNFYE